MKVQPVMEEVIDLRHRIHIKNAEKFIEVKNENRDLIQKIEQLAARTPSLLSTDAIEKFGMLRNKGNYLSVRGSSNFVRYAHRLIEVNNALRRILIEAYEN